MVSHVFVVLCIYDSKGKKCYLHNFFHSNQYTYTILFSLIFSLFNRSITEKDNPGNNTKSSQSFWLYRRYHFIKKTTVNVDMVFTRIKFLRSLVTCIFACCKSFQNPTTVQILRKNDRSHQCFNILTEHEKMFSGKINPENETLNIKNPSTFSEISEMAAISVSKE